METNIYFVYNGYKINENMLTENERELFLEALEENICTYEIYIEDQWTLEDMCDKNLSMQNKLIKML